MIYKKDDEKERLDEEKYTKNNATPASIKDKTTLENVSTDDENHAQMQIDEESFYPILFAPSQLWKSEKCNTTKTHLLEVLRRYQSLVVDVIFSLLIGRTVIIQGSEKNKR